MEQSNAIVQSERLPRLIEQAAAALAQATTAAEVLEAGELANVAYTAAKMASRLAKAKQAHDTVCAACRKAMADALMIEEQAQRRLAEEYDEAQKRGEVQKPGRGVDKKGNIPQENISTTVTDIGLTSKQIHEARFWRDAERDNPGIVRSTLDALLADGKEPTRAELRRAIAPPKPNLSPATELRARNADQGRPTMTPAPETEDDEEDEAKFGYRYARASLEGLIRGYAERSGGTEQDRWMPAQEVFEAMCAFVEDTLDLIDDGTLTVTGGDPERLDEWRELKAFVELAFPIEDNDRGWRVRGPRGGTP